MVSQEDKIKGMQEFAKSLRSGEGPNVAFYKLFKNTIFKKQLDKKENSNTKNIPIKSKENKKVDKKMLQAKRKGRGYSILNTAMGLDDSIKTKKKTLLG